ncbi:MAG: phosphonate ABC transporter, permease protein PhnE [Betaproteobacteria bacterium]|jgi:phosphonate transport system permease protein
MHVTSRWRFAGYTLIYVVFAWVCLFTLARDDGLGLGRKPWENFKRTAAEMARPSFVDVWFGATRLEYRNDEGQVLRVENRREVEVRFLHGLAAAVWTTLRIATLGTLLAGLLALPLGLLTASNLAAPKWLSIPAKFVLDACRSIHTLVFGLLLVGIVGLGPTAGILAIAAHSMGSFGKLYAEAIESLDMAAVDCVRAAGARPLQVFFLGVWPAVLPQFISTHFYIWEYNIRDSTVLGLVGAGGLGLLVSEAISLFQWSRLATILLVIVAMVMAFDHISRAVRSRLL